MAGSVGGGGGGAAAAHAKSRLNPLPVRRRRLPFPLAPPPPSLHFMHFLPRPRSSVYKEEDTAHCTAEALAANRDGGRDVFRLKQRRETCSVWNP